MNVETLRRWSENLCRTPSTAYTDLVAAIDGNEEKPPGVTWMQIDERAVGLGGVRFQLAPGLISRADFEGVFGRGPAMPQLHAGENARFVTEVKVAGAPHRCTVVAEYPEDRPDASLHEVYLRVDRARD